LVNKIPAHTLVAAMYMQGLSVIIKLSVAIKLQPLITTHRGYCTTSPPKNQEGIRGLCDFSYQTKKQYGCFLPFDSIPHNCDPKRNDK
jgi:hypothetical protein